MSFTGNYSGGRTFSNSTSSSLQQLQLSYANSNYLLYVDGTTTVQSSKVSETTIEQLNSGVFNSFSAFSFQPKSLLSNSYIFEILNYSGTNLFKIDTSNNVYFGGFSNNAGYLQIDSTGKLSVSTGTSSSSSSYTLGNSFAATSTSAPYYYNYLPIYNTQTSTLNYSASLSPYLDNAGSMYIQYNGGNNLQLNQYNIQFNESTSSTTYANKYIDFSDKDNLDYVYRIIKPAYTNPNIIHQYLGTGSFCIQNLSTTSTNNIIQFYNSQYSLSYTSNSNISKYVAAITNNGTFSGYGLTLSGLSSATLNSSGSTNYLVAVNSVSNNVGYTTYSPYFDLSGNFTSKGSITGTSFSTTGTLSSGALTATSGSFTSGLTVTGYSTSLSGTYSNYIPTFNSNDNKFTISTSSPYIDKSGIFNYGNEIKATSFYTAGALTCTGITNNSTITSTGNITSSTGNISATIGNVSAKALGITGSVAFSALYSTLSSNCTCVVINSSGVLVNSPNAPYIDINGNFTSQGSVSGSIIGSTGSFSGNVTLSSHLTFSSGLDTLLSSKNYIPGISSGITNSYGLVQSSNSPYYDGSGNFTAIGSITGTSATFSSLNSTLSSLNYLAVMNGNNLTLSTSAPSIDNYGNLTIYNSAVNTSLTSTLTNTALFFNNTVSDTDQYIQFNSLLANPSYTTATNKYQYRIWSTPRSVTSNGITTNYMDVYHCYHLNGNFNLWAMDKTLNDGNTIINFAISGYPAICSITTAGEFSGIGLTATGLSNYFLSSTSNNYLPAVNSKGQFVTSTSLSPYIDVSGNFTSQGSISGTSLSTSGNLTVTGTVNSGNVTCGTISSGTITSSNTVTAPSFALSGTVSAGYLFSNSSGTISTTSATSLGLMYYTMNSLLTYSSSAGYTYLNYSRTYGDFAPYFSITGGVTTFTQIPLYTTSSTSGLTYNINYFANTQSPATITSTYANQIYFSSIGTFKINFKLLISNTTNAALNLGFFVNAALTGTPQVVQGIYTAANIIQKVIFEYVLTVSTIGTYIIFGIQSASSANLTYSLCNIYIDVIQLA